MGKYEKILVQILRGTSDASIPFLQLCSLLEWLSFEHRQKGSHHIFTRGDVEEILNLQARGGKAKAYQVRQVRQLILKYKLGGEDEG